MTERKTEFLSMPEGGTGGGTGGGATAEQAAQIEQNTEDITELKSDIDDKLPKLPADWGGWTAEEQAVAREKLGAEGDVWELLFEFTATTEEVVAFEANLNAKYKKIFFYGEIAMSSENTANKAISVYFNDNKYPTMGLGNVLLYNYKNYVYGWIETNNSFDNWYIHCIDNATAWYATERGSKFSVSIKNVSDQNYVSYIEKIVLSGENKGFVFGVGSKLYAMGVRS